MPLIRYTKYKPGQEAQNVIQSANTILNEYTAQGFSLTLRQLYYQFISRDLFPASYANAAGIKNRIESYNKLKTIVSKAREGGLIDWDHIQDRGRETSMRPHWDSAEDFILSVAPQFNIDLWTTQTKRVEVWVEKDALSDVVARACRPLDVPYLACKGYVSASTMWEAARSRMLSNWRTYRQRTIVLHLGDHDPSGIDMTRDISERLNLFIRDGSAAARDVPDVEVQRIALTMEQIEEHQPPPNPAKDTDARFRSYEQEFGSESWELDALEPQMLVELIESHVQQLLDRRAFQARKDQQLQWRGELQRAARNWQRVNANLNNYSGEEE